MRMHRNETSRLMHAVHDVLCSIIAKLASHYWTNLAPSMPGGGCCLSLSLSLSPPLPPLSLAHTIVALCTRPSDSFFTMI